MTEQEGAEIIAKYKEEEDTRREYLERHFGQLRQQEYTEEQYEILYEAFEQFYDPFSRNYSMFKTIHDKRRIIKKYEKARDTIADLLKNDSAKEYVLKRINTAIFFETKSKEDVRKDHKEYAKNTLSPHFGKKATEEILIAFNEIKVKLENRIYDQTLISTKTWKPY